MRMERGKIISEDELVDVYEIGQHLPVQTFKSGKEKINRMVYTNNFRMKPANKGLQDMTI